MNTVDLCDYIAVAGPGRFGEDKGHPEGPGPGGPGDLYSLGHQEAGGAAGLDRRTSERHAAQRL